MVFVSFNYLKMSIGSKILLFILLFVKKFYQNYSLPLALFALQPSCYDPNPMLQMNINPIVLKRYESGCIEHELDDCVSFSASFLSILLLKCLNLCYTEEK